MARAFDLILIGLLVTSALAVIRTKDLLAAAIIFSTYSLAMCVLWQLRGAPDVALTEAAVGAGVTTVLFLATIARTTRRER
jgi:uncharacterized MnhB-related membrane protein